MNSIYDQHSSAFKDVSAFVVTNSKGERVATVAFKRGQAVTCYLHIIGLPMTRATAGGGGYDRASAAAYAAVEKTTAKDVENMHDREQYQALVDVFKKALKEGDGGSHWDRALRDNGFNVMQAV